MSFKKYFNPTNKNVEDLKHSMMFDIKLNQIMKGVMDLQQERRPKDTFHCSNIIVEPDKFCIRKQIFDYKYPQHQIISSELRRIFYNGIIHHEKWQKLFKIGGIAEKIEVTHYSKKYHLTGTPDAVINLWGKSWIVEIKSIRTEIFKRIKPVTKPISSAIIQANLYMWLTQIPRAIILGDNKNDHEVEYFFIEFDYEKIMIFLEQHLQVLEYLRNKKLPKLKCKIPVEAKDCQHCIKCFGKI